MTNVINKKIFYKRPFKIKHLLLFTLAVFFNCKMSNDEKRKYELNMFFKNTNWEMFNNETLKRNDLKHFIDDKIDFFHRKSFFLFMKDSPYNNLYDEFYLIEIEKPTGESSVSKKIIVISFNERMKSIALKKGIDDNWSEINLSNAEIKKYGYKGLKKSFKTDNNEYVIITKVNKYKFD